MKQLDIRLAIYCCVASIACGSSTEPHPQFAQISPAVQWAGGHLQVTSSLFLDGLRPDLVIGHDTIPPISTSDSGATYILPPHATGSVELALVGSGVRQDLGTITVKGFSQVRQLSQPLRGRKLHAFPWNSPRWALGYSDGGVVTLVDLLDGRQREFPSVPRVNWYAPGVSYNPGEIIVDAPARDSVETWALVPTTGLLGRHAMRNFDRHVWRLTVDKWLITSHHESTVSGGSYRDANESPWSIYFSPRGDVATISVNANLRGIPVFSLASGDSLYHVTQLIGSEAAGFSPDGESLYILSNNCCHAATIVVEVEAMSGSLKRTYTDSTLKPLALATDPNGTWVYVVAEQPDSSVTVVVLKAATLTPVGRMTPPPEGNICPCSTAFAVVPPSRQRLVVITEFQSETTMLWFDLLE